MSFSLAAAAINATAEPSPTTSAEDPGGATGLLWNATSGSPTLLDSTGAVAGRSFALALLMATSCCTNVLLIVVLQYSRTLRRRSVYRLVCNICVVNGLDTLLNCTVALGASIANGWPHPDWACRMSAFAVTMVDYLWLFCLLLLASDRLWALRDLDSYRRRFRVAPVSLAAFSMWAAALALALPAAAAPDTVPSSFVSGRFVCGVGPAAPMAYVFSCLCLGFLLPFASLCFIYVAVLVIGAKESARRAALQASTGYSQDRVTAPQAWTDLNLAKMTAGLLAVWIILAGPYTVAVNIERVKNSLELRDTLNPQRFSIAPAAETALFWLRIAFGPACPCLVLAIRPDVRRKLGHLVSCKTPKSSNHVTDGPRLLLGGGGGGEANGFHGDVNGTGTSDLSTRPGDATLTTLASDPTAAAAADASVDDQDLPETETDLAEPGDAFRAPVLFATVNGVHMENGAPPVVCDVADSQADIRQTMMPAPSAAARRNGDSDNSAEDEPEPPAAAEPPRHRRKKSGDGQPEAAPKPKKKKKRKTAPEAEAPAADSSFNSQSGLLLDPGEPPDAAAATVAAVAAASTPQSSAKRRPRRVRQNSVEPPPPPPPQTPQTPQMPQQQQQQQQQQPAQALPPCITKSPVRPKRRPDLPEASAEPAAAAALEAATEMSEPPSAQPLPPLPPPAPPLKKKRRRRASKTLPLMPQPVQDNSAFVAGDA